MYTHLCPWAKAIWDRFLYESLSIEVLHHHQDRAEPIVVVAIAIVAIEGKQTGISINIPKAPAKEERIVQGWVIRVVAEP